MQANRTSAKIKPKTKFTQKPAFDPQVFLDSAGLARKVAEFRKKETIFAQGDPAKNVLYIQKGGVRLSVVNEAGKEAWWRFWDRVIFSAKDAWPLSRSASGRRRRLPRPPRW
jgi:CRP-like cAMP-binding protein